MNSIELLMPIFLTLLRFFLFVWLPFVFIRELLTQFRQPSTKGKTVEKRTVPDAIIVKSKTLIGQIATTVDKGTPKEKQIENQDIFDPKVPAKASATIPNDELDDAFLHNGKMDIDIEMENDDELTLEQDMEDGELMALTGDIASGVSLDEMNQTIETIANSSPTEKQREQAAGVILKVRTTDMMQQVINSIPGGESRIEQILNQCEQEYKRTLTTKRVVAKKSLPKDFKLDDYIN